MRTFLYALNFNFDCSVMKEIQFCQSKNTAGSAYTPVLQQKSLTGGGERLWRAVLSFLVYKSPLRLKFFCNRHYFCNKKSTPKMSLYLMIKTYSGGIFPFTRWVVAQFMNYSKKSIRAKNNNNKTVQNISHMPWGHGGGGDPAGPGRESGFAWWEESICFSTFPKLSYENA